MFSNVGAAGYMLFFSLSISFLFLRPNWERFLISHLISLPLPENGGKNLGLVFFSVKLSVFFWVLGFSILVVLFAK